MSELLWFLVSPGGAVTVFIVLAIWIRVRPQSHTARRLFALAAVAYVCMSLWPVASAASYPLSSRFRAITEPEVRTGRTAIVLLGAGQGFVRDWDLRAVSLFGRTAMSRIVEAARVYRMAGDAWIISSGSEENVVIPTSEAMRKALIEMGIPGDRILVESASRTTHDQAIEVAKMLPAMNVDRVVLVTSDIHMLRSTGAFNAAGVTTVPAIARPWPWRISAVNWFKPDVTALNLSTDILHEYAGLISYRARGWYK